MAHRGWGYFVSGLFISEVSFGWATQEQLQPNIDDLSFEVLLIGLVAGIVTVLVTRWIRHRGGGGASDRSSAQAFVDRVTTRE